jgi:hypothetical protein
MKTGIATDNYKLDKYKQELSAKGFTEFKVVPLDIPFSEDLSVIQIEVAEEQLVEIRKICEFVEMYFNQRN